MEQYVWASGSRVDGDAQIVGEVCARLEREGRLSAKELVNESRDEDSPLHGMFEWDDAIAAEKYREVQAGKIIRSIVVKVEDSPLPFRAFSSLRPQQYVSTQKALSREDTRKFLLDSAKRELEAFRRKYRTLEELADVFRAIDGVMEG